MNTSVHPRIGPSTAVNTVLTLTVSWKIINFLTDLLIVRPYLIARKVLPQTVTIPAGGVATFKYTIDLSEMQAQENITYSEE